MKHNKNYFSDLGGGGLLTEYPMDMSRSNKQRYIFLNFEFRRTIIVAYKYTEIS